MNQKVVPLALILIALLATASPGIAQPSPQDELAAASCVATALTRSCPITCSVGDTISVAGFGTPRSSVFVSCGGAEANCMVHENSLVCADFSDLVESTSSGECTIATGPNIMIYATCDSSPA